MIALRKTLPVAVAAILLGGCAAYHPVPLAELPVGGPVRVQLSREAYEALPQISDLPGQRYEGTLVRRSDAEVVLRIPIAPGNPLGQELNIPVSGIVVGEVRTVNKPRTMLAIALGAGVFVVAVMSTSHNGPQVAPIPDNTSRDEAFTGVLARALLFSIPVP